MTIGKKQEAGEYRKNKYEIDAVAKIIKSKEAKGKDASLERGLLKSWKNFKGWEYAGKVLGDT